MSGIFTAIYSKENSIIADISFISDHEKMARINSFMTEICDNKYEITDLLGIHTILIYFGKSDLKKAQLFLDDLYEFMD